MKKGYGGQYQIPGLPGFYTADEVAQAQIIREEFRTGAYHKNLKEAANKERELFVKDIAQKFKERSEDFLSIQWNIITEILNSYMPEPVLETKSTEVIVKIDEVMDKASGQLADGEKIEVVLPDKYDELDEEERKNVAIHYQKYYDMFGVMPHYNTKLENIIQKINAAQ